MPANVEIDFLKGHHSIDLLSTDKLSKAYDEVLKKDYKEYEADNLNVHPLTYGTNTGNLDVRESIARWLEVCYSTINIDPDTINLTGGASYGCTNILNSVTDTKLIARRAYLVTPTYFLINAVFLDAGFQDKITSIKETPNGEDYEIDLKALQKSLEFYDQGEEDATADKEINICFDPCTRTDRKFYRYVIYMVPTYSNPGGISYSIKTRTRLI